MGCDGGTIPKRDELVKTKKKPEQKDKKSERKFRWKHCAISQQPLRPPVVACELGRLYSKETVLETLLNKSEGVPETAAHIRNLKDVKELQLTENPAWDKETSATHAEVGDAYIDDQKAEWICPISGQEMNGSFKFSFIWSCGCVLSEKALKEMKKVNPESTECLRCQKPFSFDDVIFINPTEEEEQSRQVEKMTIRRLLSKKNKSSKKRSAEATSTGESKTTTEGELKVNVKVKVEPSPDSGSSSSSSSSKSNNGKGEIAVAVASSSSLSSSSSKLKLNGSSSSSAIPAKKAKLVTALAKDEASSKMKNYSVAKDPKTSETYKSLFTTHETAQNQTKAHWVTYNPFYN